MKCAYHREMYDDEPRTIQPIGSLIQQRQPQQGKKVNERGELLKYFSQKLEKPIPMVASLLKHRMDTPTLQDLYYIKSACDQYAARPPQDGGGEWSKAFYGSLKPKP